MKAMIIVSMMMLSLFAEDNATQNFEAIEVEGKELNTVFAPQDYLESQTYLKNAPMQRQLTIAEVKNIPGTMGDPIKAVKILAGVTSTGSSGEMIIHASKAQETLYTLNHLPLGYLFHFNGFHSVISPEATDQLNLYLGGFDNTYTRATGGVLDINVKYPMGDNEGYVHVGLFDSSFGYDAEITENTSLFVGGRRSYFEVLTPLFTQLSQPQEETNTTFTITQVPNYWDGTLLLTHQMDNHQLSLEVIAAEDAFNAIIDGNVEDPEFNGPLDMAQGFLTTGARWMYEDESYTANSLLYNVLTESRQKVFDLVSVTATEIRTGLKHISTYEQDNHKFSAGGQLYNYYVPLEAEFNSTGLDEQDKLFFPPDGKIDETLNIYIGELFVQDLYSITDWMRFRYGLSYDTSTTNNMKNNIDPRAAVIVDINDEDTVSVSGGKYSRSPDGAYLLENIGNPDLLMETSYHLNISYKHTFDEGHYIAIEPYAKVYDNLAINDTTNEESLNYLSVGEGKGYGVDVTYKFVNDSWYILGSYTYVNANRQLDSADATLYNFESEIPNTLNVVASYNPNEKWNLSTLVKLQNGAVYTPVSDVYDMNGTYVPVYGSSNSARLDYYFTLNIKAMYTQKLKKYSRIEYAFEIMNATNHENPLSIRFDDTTGKSEISNDLPRLPWFDVTYYF